jgi:hypothetical protein
VLPSLFQLLQNYLLSAETQPVLEKQGAHILINVLQIQGVVNSTVDQLVKESHSALDNPALLQVAVRSALNNIRPQS